MYHVLHREEQRLNSTGRSVTFEGEPYGAGISFFVIDSDPGEGPEPHRHPYSETFVVRSGNVRFLADQDEIDGGAGDIVVVEPEVWHGFTNLGPGRLEITCIQAAGRMITTWLDEQRT